MATTTSRLGLVKPGYSDTADIADINANMDRVDGFVSGFMPSPYGVAYFGSGTTGQNYKGHIGATDEYIVLSHEPDGDGTNPDIQFVIGRGGLDAIRYRSKNSDGTGSMSSWQYPFSYFYSTTLSDFLTAGTGVTFVDGGVARYGNRWQISFRWQYNEDISVIANGNVTDFTVATLKSGFRPRVTTFAASSGLAATELQYGIAHDGTITLYRCDAIGAAYTISSGTNNTLRAIYIL